MKFFKFIIAFIIIAVIVGAGFAYGWYKNGGLEKFLIKQAGTMVVGGTGQENLFQELIGMDKPRTYLLLFLNNTELRPGGGFIGSYGVVRVDKGKPEILKVEGTEILDGQAPSDFVSEPPAPLKKYLNIKRWNFRDSNWSPDFSQSSKKSLELYQKENGVSAGAIDAVVGFTPTIIEEILKITGPIKVDGQEFNSGNFLEKLEYEVEYGYVQKGVEKVDRKKLLSDLATVLLGRLKTDVITHWSDFYRLANQMLSEKQVVVYSVNDSWQKAAVNQKWAGVMSTAPGDYLLWVDANLSSLKTDWAIKRELSYQITPTTSGQFIGKVKMKYVHTGSFDWRTTRYRTYARVYLPSGSKWLKTTGSLKKDRSSEAGDTDVGIENGRAWFGTFISIEPGKTGELSFEFLLSPAVVETIRSGDYDLTAQKQIGTIANKLTLGLDFGKQLVSAVPGENPDKYGDHRYDWTGDMRIDREFQIKLK